MQPVHRKVALLVDLGKAVAQPRRYGSDGVADNPDITDIGWRPRSIDDQSIANDDVERWHCQTPPLCVAAWPWTAQACCDAREMRLIPHGRFGRGLQSSYEWMNRGPNPYAIRIAIDEEMDV